MKIMLDTQIYDWIIDTPEMVERLNRLSREGKVRILCTHIQEDELVRIPDEKKRAAVASIIKEKVPTSGGVFNVSKWNEFSWGDGSPGGFSIDDVRSPSKGHTEDALIATTAVRDADVLVTEDRRLANRMQTLSARCQIWRFDELKKYVWGSFES